MAYVSPCLSVSVHHMYHTPIGQKSQPQNGSQGREVVIFANGMINPQGLAIEKIKIAMIIAVDGGLDHCDSLKIVPDFVVGDFDSANPEILKKYENAPSLEKNDIYLENKDSRGEKIRKIRSSVNKVLFQGKQVEVHKLPHDKDETDTEYALSLIDWTRFSKVSIISGLGGRSDHNLQNMRICSRYPGKIFFESEKELIFSINATNPKVIVSGTFTGQTVSLFHDNSEKTGGIYTKGLKWELENGTLSKHFDGVSNECLDSIFSVEVKGPGDLIVIINKLSTEVLENQKKTDNSINHIHRISI